MARVVKGFMFGTRYGLTFYMMDGNLYVRLKSTLSRKKVKYSERFQRTMQSAGELGRASKVAARVYRELSREQRKIVSVLYKKMTGVAKMAFKDGKSEEEAEREVREYLVKEGVVKKEVVEVGEVVEEKEPMGIRKTVVKVKDVPRVVVVRRKIVKKEGVNEMGGGEKGNRKMGIVKYGKGMLDIEDGLRRTGMGYQSGKRKERRRCAAEVMRKRRMCESGWIAELYKVPVVYGVWERRQRIVNARIKLPWEKRLRCEEYELYKRTLPAMEINIRSPIF